MGMLIVSQSIVICAIITARNLYREGGVGTWILSHEAMETPPPPTFQHLVMNCDRTLPSFPSPDAMGLDPSSSHDAMEPDSPRNYVAHTSVGSRRLTFDWNAFLFRV